MKYHLNKEYAAILWDGTNPEEVRVWLRHNWLKEVDFDGEWVKIKDLGMMGYSPYKAPVWFVTEVGAEGDWLSAYKPEQFHSRYVKV
jgi:hypothetical protein